MPRAANFNRLAGCYRFLEFLAFGRDLERTRFCLLDRLAGCRSILILGEGDGRCLAQLVRLAPQATVDCLDASGGMLARARDRLPAEARPRVRFIEADARTRDYPPEAYDGVVTLFFLDCFTAEAAADIVGRVARSLKLGGLWLFADFVVPPRGLARLRARVWLAVLYTFFRLETGLDARALPPSEVLIVAAGLRADETRSRQWGLLRTVIFRKGSG